MITDIKITSTPTARAFIKQRGALDLKIGVKRTGCSGYAYTFDTIHETQSADLAFPQEEGVTLYVSPEDLKIFQGSVILDYVQDGLSKRLTLVNPNEKSRCGCGESFII